MTTTRAILVVGDDGIFTELLGKMPSTRCNVIFAATLAEGLEQLAAHSPRVVIAALGDGPRPHDLLIEARGRHQAHCIGVTSNGQDAPGAELCDELFATDDTERIVQTAASWFPAASSPSNPIDFKELEQRVHSIAMGITGGLAEVLQAIKGLAEGLSLHATMLRQLEPPDESGRLVTHTAGDRDSPELERRFAVLGERLGRLEERVGEVAGGTTGGFSELLQATDGLGQGLKAHARSLSELERRLHEVSARQTEWQNGLVAAREVRSKTAEEPASLEQRLKKLTERLNDLVSRVAEVAVGVTGGLSELLQATDGLGQGLKEQARLIAELQRRLQ